MLKQTIVLQLMEISVANVFLCFLFDGVSINIVSVGFSSCPIEKMEEYFALFLDCGSFFYILL